MRPELFSIGPITIYGYGFMIALGIIAATLTADHRAKKNGLSPDIMLNMAIIGVVGGIVGAKLLFWITDIKNIIADPSKLLNLSGGFVVYGGLIVGILAAYLYGRKKKINIMEYLDIAVASVALGQAFGRLGCLMAGCCYGKETHSGFSITFTHSDYAPNGVELIPSQIIYSVADFAMFLILLLLYKKLKDKAGRITALYVILYSIGRFALEFIRGDLERGSVGIFSTSQFISIGILVLGIIMFVLCSKKNVK